MKYKLIYKLNEMHCHNFRQVAELLERLNIFQPVDFYNRLNKEKIMRLKLNKRNIFIEKLWKK
jgi:hypothetical protein